MHEITFSFVLDVAEDEKPVLLASGFISGSCLKADQVELNFRLSLR